MILKKAGKNKRISKNLTIKLIFVLIMVLAQSSCEKTIDNYENNPALTAGATLSLVREPRRQSGGEAILLRGNNWVFGIPGFEDNSFSAITGEYRLQAPGTGAECLFSIHLTAEFLHFSTEWLPRRGIDNMRVLEQSTGDNLIISIIMDDGRGLLWTAIFNFPSNIAGRTLSDAALNQFLRAWSNRFLYFLSLARTRGDISIPAVVEF